MANLVKVINALGHETTYSFDEQNNKLTQTDAEGRTTQWAYDDVGRVTRREYLSSGRTVDTVYTVTGQVAMLTDHGGITSYT